jgi:hypothetical protein
MSEIQAISGTRRALKEMADGTIRVQVDIDPRFKAEFLRLFPNIDAPCALAPLVADFEQREPEPEKPKGGALAKLAGMLCTDPEFWAFLTKQFTLTAACGNAEEAAEIIREACGVQSRADLDNDPDAAAEFHRLVRGPWQKHCQQRGRI